MEYEKECIFHICKCIAVRVCVFVHECRWLNVDVLVHGSKQRKEGLESVTAQETVKVSHTDVCAV